MTKRIFFTTVALAIAGCVAVASCNKKEQENDNNNDNQKVAVTGVTVTPVSSNIEVPQTLQLTAGVMPANATHTKVVWTSSDNAKATVDATGLVTGKAAGTATITATTEDGGKTAHSTITVTAPVPTPPTAPVTWYVSTTDLPEGTAAGTAQTMKAALGQIAVASSSFTGEKKAVVVVHGTLTPATEGSLSNNSLVSITGAYPPVVLRGSASGGTLDAQNKYRVLYILGNNVTLAAGITLANGNTAATGESYGGGVYIEKTTLAMTGGTISNCTAIYGAGVCVHDDKQGVHSSFTMTGGTITGGKNTSSGSGAGVFIDWYCSFTLSGTGVISQNGADGKTDTGGGVGVDGHATFTMTGGEIRGNRGASGGGVSVSAYGSFAMTGGTITDNTAPANSGSGVFVSSYGGAFHQTGGAVIGNHGEPQVQR